VNLFVKLADDSEEVPALKGKQYANFHLDLKDWEKMKQMKEVLQESVSATQTFLSLCDPTVWCTILVLEFLIKTWEKMAAVPQYDKVCNALITGLDNLAKWYKK
ncbi:hypothetical protein L208DRAFT_1215012, partial [Tricholoma matsutake]